MPAAGGSPINRTARWKPEGLAASSSANAGVPTVAHCIAGLTRSFPRPLVYQSLKYHLIDAFGGVPSVFLLIKAWRLSDSRDARTAAADVVSTATESEVRLQLRGRVRDRSAPRLE